MLSPCGESGSVGVDIIRILELTPVYRWLSLSLMSPSVSEYLYHWYELKKLELISSSRKEDWISKAAWSPGMT